MEANLLGFVTFALVAVVGLLIALIIMFFPSRKKEPNAIGLPGDFPTNSEGNASAIKEEGSLHKYLCGLHARHGPVAAFHLNDQVVASVASFKLFEQIRLAFNRPAELFKLYEPLFTGSSLLYMNGEDGQRRHTLLRKAFQGDALQRFYGTFTSAAQEYSTKYTNTPTGEHVNITRDMYQLATAAFTQAAFGGLCSKPSELKTWLGAFQACWLELENRLDWKEPSEEREKDFEKNRKLVRDAIVRCIKSRRAMDVPENQRLFVDHLLSEGRDEDALVADAMTFLCGALPTTAYLLVWCLYYLASNEDIQEKVAKEAKEVLGTSGVTNVQNIASLRYTKQVVDETLRCSALMPWTARVFAEDTTVGEHTIPAKVPVVVALGVVLQDVAVWPKPQRFNPDRFAADKKPKSYSAGDMFGLSGRRCPGFQFANTEVVVMLSMLCRSCRFDLVPRQQEVNSVHGLVSHPSQDIEVTVAKR